MRHNQTQTMKKIFIAAAALAALASCSKEEQPAITENGAANIVNLSFVASQNQLSRAFFDPSATTEAWEKSISSLSVFCFNTDGKLLLRRNFTPSEITAKKATFSLPNSAAGTSLQMFAIANAEIADIATKDDLLKMKDSAPQLYNGTFAEVSTTAKRAGGFQMSGNKTVTVSNDGKPTNVALTLSRSVAKIAVQTTIDPEFASKYPGKVKITSATISRANASVTYVEPTAAIEDKATYTHDQDPSVSGSAFNNLFYIFPNPNRAAGGRVLLTLEALYDRDGNFTTTTDQSPVSYEVELTGDAATGAIKRNSYYRIAVTLTGLTGSDMSISVSVADWLTPVTQEVSLGQ